MTKVEALREVITELGGTPVGNSVAVLVHEIAALVDGIGGGEAYTLPTASTTTLGGVKVDGTTIVINDGVISVAPANTQG